MSKLKSEDFEYGGAVLRCTTSGRGRRGMRMQPRVQFIHLSPSPRCSFSDRVEGGRSSQQLTITDN